MYGLHIIHCVLDLMKKFEHKKIYCGFQAANLIHYSLNIYIKKLNLLLYMDTQKHNIKYIGGFLLSVTNYIAELSSSRYKIQDEQHNAIDSQDIGDEFLK